MLPEYDNALLSHADRSRFHVDRSLLSAVRGPVRGTVLSDGFVCGVWRVEHEREDASATLAVEHVVKLTKRAASAIAAEAERYLRFVAGDVSKRDVRLLAAT